MLTLNSSVLVFLCIWKVLLCVWLASRALTVWRLTHTAFPFSKWLCRQLPSPGVCCSPWHWAEQVSCPSGVPAAEGIAGGSRVGLGDHSRNHEQHREPWACCSQNRAQGHPAPPPDAPPLLHSLLVPHLFRLLST